MIEERLDFASRDELEAWLEREHATCDGVWLALAKKGATRPGVTHEEALELALCFGWIDTQVRRLDDERYLLRFTPRRRASRWSKINRSRALALIEQGRMRPAGLREVRRAQADGRWEAAYDGQRAATVPDDLRAALDADPAARAAFDALDSHNRYAILYRVGDAKRPETRARRIAGFVAMLRDGGRPHP